MMQVYVTYLIYGVSLMLKGENFYCQFPGQRI